MSAGTMCIIGAGPSGLVAAKHCMERGYEVRLLELSKDIGGTFVHKSYKDAHLVSSKYITAFSDERWTTKSVHPSLPEYVQYCLRYAEKHQITQHISFNTRALNIARSPDSHRLLVTMKGAATGEVEVVEYDAVLNCSGLHQVPIVPAVPGLEKFRGVTMHSSQYRNSDVFKGKRVVIMGCGETGLDLSHQAVHVAKEVTLSVRRGFLSVPTQVGDLALDTMITNIFESCYQHPWVERWGLRWKFSTFFIKLGFTLSSGSSCGFNQWAGCLLPTKRGYHIINKSTKAMPYINAAVKKKSWLGRLYSFLDGDTEGKEITVVKGIKEVCGPTTVRMEDGTTREADVLLWATGYELDSTLTKLPLPTIHNVIHPDVPNLGWIGFVRPNVGAIPPMAEMQVMWWLERERHRPALHRYGYRLLGQHPRTAFYAVDYGIYMHKLAQEISAAPSFWFLLRCGGWRAAYAYALGQAYVPWFRVQGPFATDEALNVGRTELYETVRRRGVISNGVFLWMSSVFFAINGCAWGVHAALTLLRRLFITPFHSHTHEPHSTSSSSSSSSSSSTSSS